MRNAAILVSVFCAHLLTQAPVVADVFPPLVATWGSYGSGPGQFAGPGGVCIEGSSYVYIADQGNNRIQKWTADGAFVMQWGQYGSGPGDLFHPTRIHLAANGELYVAEHQNHRISRFTRNGVFLGFFADSGPGRVTHPVGIATDATGKIYVVGATTHRVHKYASDGTFLLSWGGYGSGHGEFTTPYAVEVGPDGFVYVGEYDGSRIQKFTTDGVFVQSWGSYGSGPGEFIAVEGIAFDADGKIYVADTGNDRIQKFSPDGTYLGEVAVPYSEQGRPIPSDVATDPQGSLYVVGAGSARLYKYGNRPPDCSGGTAVLARDWPPNHQLVSVTIAGVHDPEGDPVTVRVTGIIQDEPLKAEDRTCPDGVIDADGNARVRLERLSPLHGGNGRVYRLTFEATDGRGTCAGAADVCVPLRRGGQCLDPIVNSLGPCVTDFGAAQPITE